MDVAEARLAESGYLGVPLEEVAREVGVTKPALYYHFPEGKEQLMVEIAHRALRRIRIGLERAMSGPESGAGRLAAAARWLMDEGARGRPVNELRDLAEFVAEEHRGGLAKGFYESLYGPIRRTISSAIDAGEFRANDPEFLTWAFLGLTSGMLDVQRMPASSPRPDGEANDTGEMPDRMVDLFLRGVLA
jgi:AcrR family transcriptional regulator